MHQLQCRFVYSTKISNEKAVGASQMDSDNHKCQKRWWKMCDIVYEIHILMNFLFKFWWMNQILLKINSF